MNFKTTLFASAAMAVLAGAASANPLGNVDLTFGYETYEDGDATGTWVKGETDLELGAFDAELGLTYGDLGEDDTTWAVDTKVSKDLGAVTAGAFFDHSVTENDDNAWNGHYGLTGDYDMGAVGVEAYAGWGNYNSDVQADEYQTKVYGVTATFDLPGAFDAAAFFNTEEADMMDVTEKGLAVGYDMSSFAVPVYAALSVSKVDTKVDGGANTDGTKAGFTLTVPLGGKADKGVKLANSRSTFNNQNYMTAE